MFDEETSEIPNKEQIAREFTLGSNKNFEIARVEGTATSSDFERLYLDLAIFRNKNLVLLCESKSSILNGAVEGPYFEEVIKRISI